MDSINHGITISGGIVNAGSIAAGPNAVAHSTGDAGSGVSLDELRSMLRDLTLQVRAVERQIEDGPAVVAAVEDVERAAAEPDPDRGRVIRRLKEIAQGVGSVASLATSVAAVQQVAAQIL